jgi:hypothetical protein
MADPQAAAIAERLRAMIAEAASTLVVEVTANLIEATPVDTGHARANWVPSVGEPFSGEVDGAAAQAAGMIAVTAYKLGDGPLNVTNNTDYIEALIAGSSSQAAAGWDLTAIDQAQQTVQQRYDALQVDVSSKDGGKTVAIAPRVPDGDK